MERTIAALPILDVPRHLSALATLLLTSAITHATAEEASQNWKQIETTDQSPYTLYVDTADIVHDGSIRLFIAKMVPATSSNPIDLSDIGSVLVRVKVDCRANTIEPLSARMIDQGGEATDLQRDPPRQIKAGTDDMMMRKLVC
jgi:hypothetical protein